MKTPITDNQRPTRRDFLRRGALGAWLFGLGSAFGLFANRAPAQPVKPVRSGQALGKEYSYDLGKLGKTDPKLILYAETGKFATGLKEVRGLAVGLDDRIYVTGDRAMVVFDKKGARLSGFSLNEAPRCMAIGEKGLFYVGMKDHVELYSPEGVRQSRWESAGKNAVITSVAVSEQDVFVADAGNRIVLRYNSAGQLIKRIGKKDPTRGISGFIVPSPYFALAIGPGNLLWVANPGQHRLEAYTFDGELEAKWGEVSTSISGFCGCCNPVHFALLPDGKFITSEKGLVRIKVYSAKGEFEGVVAGPELFPKLADNLNANPVGLDVAVDSGGSVFIADPSSNDVRIFSRLKTTS